LNFRKIHSVFQILSSGTRRREVQTRHNEVYGDSDFQVQGEHNADFGHHQGIRDYGDFTARILPALEYAGNDNWFPVRVCGERTEN
jgi:hypothetical protein